jgi:hypothetical protein
VEERLMRSRLVALISVLLLVGFLCVPLISAAPALPETGLANGAHAGYGTFAGHAQDILTGLPVPGAFVRLKGSAVGTYTDSDGGFRLIALPGTWELVVSAPGYLTMSQVLLRALPGQTVRADFELVVENPDLAQQADLFRLMITPPEQALDSDDDVELAMSSVPSTIRVLLPDGQVVEMDVDEYLKGVVPWEMPPSAPLEALKAQAVAARSYAVTSWNHVAQGANVCTTTHCQVWNNIRFSRTDQAVEETRGMVATYGGSIIRAYYFGHCDGHTRNSEDVWIQALPYCRSVVCECGFTSMWGHGVGMCQEGAIAMARRGASFGDILRHYYSGVSIVGVQPTPTPAPTITPTPTPDPVATINYPLQAGWNLISIPVDITDKTTSNVLAPISGQYDLAMQYDAMVPYSHWKVYDATVAVQTGGLGNLDTRYGIWLRATSACTLTVSGRRIATATDIPLTTGLNLVGYPSLEARPIADALSSIEGKYIRVYTYGAGQSESSWLLFDFTVPVAVTALTQMKPGSAYWIEMVQPAVWRVEP